MQEVGDKKSVQHRVSTNALSVRSYQAIRGDGYEKQADLIPPPLPFAWLDN